MKNRIRNIFIAGLLVILPLSITYFFLIFLFRKLDDILAPTFKRLLLFFHISSDGYLVPGLGLFTMLAVVFLVGLITRNVVGKKMVEIGERLVAKIPLVRSIYIGAKQFLEAVTLSNNNIFRQVALVEYPRKGLYSIGFITGTTEGEVQLRTERQVINVFIPTTPNPTSGMLVMVPQEEIIPLAMTVEEGIKFVISWGVVVPKPDPETLSGLSSPLVPSPLQSTTPYDNLTKEVKSDGKETREAI
ncbi:MAG: DUF502 domain-containing protein [Nitrospinota bacterium]|nr:MAG: DUF502 domain-containing protein [Nitrospinota bacterium]